MAARELFEDCARQLATLSDEAYTDTIEWNPNCLLSLPQFVSCSGPGVSNDSPTEASWSCGDNSLPVLTRTAHDSSSTDVIPSRGSQYALGPHNTPCTSQHASIVHDTPAQGVAPRCCERDVSKVNWHGDTEHAAAGCQGPFSSSRLVCGFLTNSATPSPIQSGKLGPVDSEDNSDEEVGSSLSDILSSDEEPMKRVGTVISADVSKPPTAVGPATSDDKAEQSPLQSPPPFECDNSSVNSTGAGNAPYTTCSSCDNQDLLIHPTDISSAQVKHEAEASSSTYPQHMNNQYRERHHNVENKIQDPTQTEQTSPATSDTEISSLSQWSIDISNISDPPRVAAAAQEEGCSKVNISSPMAGKGRVYPNSRDLVRTPEQQPDRTQANFLFTSSPLLDDVNFSPWSTTSDLAAKLRAGEYICSCLCVVCSAYEPPAEKNVLGSRIFTVSA